MRSVPTDVTLYGLSKGAAEELVKQSDSYAIVRFSSIVGPGMKPTSMMPKMVNQAMAENRITVYGDGSRMQNYIDVRDAANLLVLSAKTNDNIIVLGIAPREFSNLQVATFIAQETGASIYFEGTDATTGFHYEDHGAHEHIGFKPKFDLHETIRDIIAS
jgi:UDP-glucose 4-epimerase